MASLFHTVNGELVEMRADDAAAIQAEWAANAAKQAAETAQAAAAQQAADKARADRGTFVAGMKALLAQQAKQPGAAPEIQAAAAVDISAVDTVAILQP